MASDSFSTVSILHINREAVTLQEDVVLNNANTLYDVDGDGTVDNSVTVNGHTVEIDIVNIPITQLNALDDWELI